MNKKPTSQLKKLVEAKRKVTKKRFRESGEQSTKQVKGRGK
jgi:hypothetical protein